MAEYQITYWRNIPSMIIVKAGDETLKGILPARFQEAIDEAAMRLGETDSDSYLAGWNKGQWITAEGELTQISENLVASLESEFTQEKLQEILDNL